MEVRSSPIVGYTWKYILSSRNLLVKGVKKVVGKGNNIDIWVDPWVPTLPNFRVLSSDRGENAPRYVQEIITKANWDVVKLRELFSVWEYEAIVRIPIPMAQCEDKWCRHPSKHGEFSVRSAYYLELVNQRNLSASTS